MAEDKWIAGFAKLQGEDFEFYMQRYSIILGRNSKKSSVDLDLAGLGGGMNISRQHAKISYSFERRQFELEVLGKNGAYINGQVCTGGGTPVKLHSQDCIRLGDKSFYFLLGKRRESLHPPAPPLPPAQPTSQRRGGGSDRGERPPPPGGIGPPRRRGPLKKRQQQPSAVGEPSNGSGRANGHANGGLDLNDSPSPPAPKRARPDRSSSPGEYDNEDDDSGARRFQSDSN